MNYKHIPNLITLLRFVLVWPVVTSLLNKRYDLALVLFVVAAISDGLDGFLAKHYKWSSRLGGILDPLADKALLVACFIVLTVQGLIPESLLILAIARDLIIVLGATAYQLFIGPLQPEPRAASKLNTFLQIVLIIGLILDQVVGFPTFFIPTLIAIVYASTIISGIDYMIVWGLRAFSRFKSKTP